MKKFKEVVTIPELEFSARHLRIWNLISAKSAPPDAVFLIHCLEKFVKYDTTVIHLNKKFKTYFGENKKKLSKAIKYLEKQSVMSPTPTKDIYWLNPEYIFKGNIAEYMMKYHPDSLRE
jgi:hypothetical protein